MQPLAYYFEYKTMNFSEWITSELERRGWSRREAARRGGFSPSILDKVVNGFSEPGVKFINGIAKAFEMDPSEVMDRMHQNPQNESSLDEKIRYKVSTLPTEEDKRDVLAYIELRHRMAEERGKHEDKTNQSKS
jgi:transcriptional regulator with XRE-family HTH domain